MFQLSKSQVRISSLLEQREAIRPISLGLTHLFRVNLALSIVKKICFLSLALELLHFRHV